VVVLLFGVAILAGLVRLRPGRPTGSTGNGLMARLDQQITVRVAAVAGPLTHIPGIFYLVALNLIVAHNPELAGGLIAVAIYDAIWFAVPIAALMICMVNPDAARDLVLAVAEWARSNARTIVLTTSFVVGVALVVRGVLAA
jgi:hypothetical protein